MVAQRVEQRGNAAPADERHHQVDAVGRVEFGEELVPDPWFARSVCEQRRVEQRDEGLGNRLGPSVRSPAQDSSEDRPGFNWRFGADIGAGDGSVDLLNQCSCKRDPYRNTLGIVHAGERPLDDPTEMKGQSVGFFCRPHVIGDRVPLAAQVSELFSDCVRDENFVQTARATVHGRLRPRGSTATHGVVVAGHSEIQMTQRYMHLSPAALDAAIQLLDGRGHAGGRGNILATATASAGEA